MKVSKIRFNSYLHFKDGLEVDLTYPMGHEKAGQPLDRICIVGQSGTGKTSILNLIKYFTADGKDLDLGLIDHERLGQNSVEMHYQIGENEYCKSPHGGGREGFVIKKNGKTLSAEYNKELESLLRDSFPLLVSFPFNVIPQEGNTIRSDKNLGGIDEKNQIDKNFDSSKGTIERNNGRRIWDVSNADISTISTLVFKEIDNYVEKHRKVSDALLASAKKNTVESKAFIDKINEWEASNPNPIKEIGESFLIEILEKIGLTLETEIEKYYGKECESRKNIENFFVLSQKGAQIKLPYLSTGTKQLIYTAIPLFFLKPKESIVLLDQPEASLYPDIQLLVPEIYVQMAPDCQFFFATHSPIVASAFDPWEIVELYYDQALQSINVRPYYHVEKGRHVNNYSIYPKYLRWDSIFKLMLGMTVESNEAREEQLMKLAILESEIKKAKSKEEKLSKYNEYRSLANKLDTPQLSIDEKDR